MSCILLPKNDRIMPWGLTREGNLSWMHLVESHNLYKGEHLKDNQLSQH